MNPDQTATKGFESILFAIPKTYEREDENWRENG